MFEFSAGQVCASCKENIVPPKKILRCSACKAVIYCSAECAKRDWGYPSMPGLPTHKMLCPHLKRHMERIPQTQALVKSFPWGRLESDDSMNFDIARGRFGVLGGPGFGYWSHRSGHIPHSEPSALDISDAPYVADIRKHWKSSAYLDGKDLLKGKHVSDKEGWKLPSNLIPYRNFFSPSNRPELVTEFEEGVVDWESWYRWRKLTKDSPAALLMNYPLSVYQMLVNCLEVASPKAGRPDKRIPLHVHLLGVEVELNYLPLFSEIALLLPYHDIKLVLFGGAVARLVKEAQTSPGSLASKSPVFTYQSPPECGSGAISVYLHSASANWSARGNYPALEMYGSRPDALVACNAGLASYREWTEVIQAVHVERIPFATTEYIEQSVEHQRDVMPMMLSGTSASPRPFEEYEIQLNPFQRPGQRQVPMYRLPNLINGFTLVVFKTKDPKNTNELKARKNVDIEKALGNLSLESLD
ncbi:hypothetical protein GALMADRAFT_74898 [Galerina marginata CBS 339.88]|uniref:MYND-type domain-containing protein n=1 Tax=Galerina marginata (strain CBS 339.88) TaxID=685588 RepID=A0A067SNJ3_GALM3|nr:hypothetical protein GALMADRAFT_74898 [Galerina marginata CBS 339.88]